jgi:hypothetical protein
VEFDDLGVGFEDEKITHPADGIGNFSAFNN